MGKPRAKLLSDKTTTHYIVQTNWPDTSRGDENDRFTSYYSSAYVSKDSPTQYLRQSHPHLFDGANSDGCRFLTYEAALPLANFLRENGRLSAGWIGDSQEQHKKMLRGPLKVRIVLHSSRTTEHVMEYPS